MRKCERVRGGGGGGIQEQRELASPVLLCFLSLARDGGPSRTASSAHTAQRRVLLDFMGCFRSVITPKSEYIHSLVHAEDRGPPTRCERRRMGGGIGRRVAPKTVVCNDVLCTSRQQFASLDGPEKQQLRQNRRVCTELWCVVTA